MLLVGSAFLQFKDFELIDPGEKYICSKWVKKTTFVRGGFFVTIWTSIGLTDLFQECLYNTCGNDAFEQRFSRCKFRFCFLICCTIVLTKSCFCIVTKTNVFKIFTFWLRFVIFLGLHAPYFCVHINYFYQVGNH